jgi:hypothetical protein
MFLGKALKDLQKFNPSSMRNIGSRKETGE